MYLDTLYIFVLRTQPLDRVSCLVAGLDISLPSISDLNTKAQTGSGHLMLPHSLGNKAR